MNLDETSFLCNYYDIKVVRIKTRSCHDKNCSGVRFSITLLLVGSAAGVNGSVIFLTKGENMHPKLRSNNLVTRYGL